MFAQSIPVHTPILIVGDPITRFLQTSDCPLNKRQWNPHALHTGSTPSMAPFSPPPGDHIPCRDQQYQQIKHFNPQGCLHDLARLVHQVGELQKLFKLVIIWSLVLATKIDVINSRVVWPNSHIHHYAKWVAHNQSFYQAITASCRLCPFK